MSDENQQIQNLRRALNSVLAKYDEPGLGVGSGLEYRVEEGETIKILEIADDGSREYIEVPIDDFVVS